MKAAESREQTAFAKNLRQRQTDAESKLWAKLRGKQLEEVKFRRQQPIGPYIVDFVSFESKLVVEIDGGQHNEDKIREKDEARTALIKGKGYRVLRFWDNEALTNIEGVLERIRESLITS